MCCTCQPGRHMPAKYKFKVHVSKTQKSSIPNTSHTSPTLIGHHSQRRETKVCPGGVGGRYKNTPPVPHSFYEMSALPLYHHRGYWGNPQQWQSMASLKAHKNTNKSPQWGPEENSSGYLGMPAYFAKKK